MKKIFWLLCLLLSCSCRTDSLQPVSLCGVECLPASPWIPHPSVGDRYGECKMGRYQCEDDGGLTCIGWIAPADEVCDGLDNDCNGAADDNIPTETCQSSCGWGVRLCVKGIERCNAPQGRPERRDGGFNDCDGIDDDCDGVIDNPEQFGIEFCYTGDPTQLTYPGAVCRPGVKYCSGLRWKCSDTLPSSEICNGKDDDCDGKIDDGVDSGTHAVDLVIVMDNSGSMGPYQASVQMATANWTNKYGMRPEIRFALVTASDSDYATWGDKVRMFQDFTNPTTFNSALALQSITGSGNEPTLDALMLLADSQNPLQLSWRSSATKVVVMFSDEAPQSYFSFGTQSGYTQNVSITDVNMACARAGVKVYVFTSIYDTTAWNDWSAVVAAVGGTETSISGGFAVIETELDKIIENGGCTP